MSPTRDRNDEPTERIRSQRPERGTMSVPTSLVLSLLTLVTGGGAGAYVRHVTSPASHTSRAEIDAIVVRLDRVEQRAEDLRNGATRTETRLDAMDHKLDKMDQKLDQLVDRRH